MRKAYKWILAIGVVAVIVAVSGVSVHRSQQWEYYRTLETVVCGGELYTFSTITRGHSTDSVDQAVFKNGDFSSYIKIADYYGVWDSDKELMVYCDGRKLKTCGVEGENEHTIYSPFGLGFELREECVMGDYAIIKKLSGKRFKGNYMGVNLNAKEVIDLGVMGNMSFAPIAWDEDSLYFAVSTISYEMSYSGETTYRCSIYCYDIAAGEPRLIYDTSDETDILDGGAVQDGVLYFFDRASNRICALDISTGETVFEVTSDNVSKLWEKDGKLLYAKVHSQMAIIGQVDTATGELTKLWSKRCWINPSSIAVTDEYVVLTTSGDREHTPTVGMFEYSTED